MEKISSDPSSGDYFSSNFHRDTFKEHEEWCRDLSDELPMMIQQIEHIEEHKLEEDVIHDETSVEGNLKAHFEPMTEEDELPTIEQGNIDAVETSRHVVFLDNSPIQGYVDRACNTTFQSFIHPREREENFSLLVNQKE